MNSQTTHGERVSGWIILCVTGIMLAAMLIAAFCPRLSVIAQTSVINIATTGMGILGTAFTYRQVSRTPDSSQQVTVPSGDSAAPVTVTTSTGVVPPVDPEA